MITNLYAQASPIFGGPFLISIFLVLLLVCAIVIIAAVIALNRWIDRRAEAKKDQADQDAT